MPLLLLGSVLVEEAFVFGWLAAFDSLEDDLAAVIALLLRLRVWRGLEWPDETAIGEDRLPSVSTSSLVIRLWFLLRVSDIVNAAVFENRRTVVFAIAIERL